MTDRMKKWTEEFEREWLKRSLADPTERHVWEHHFQQQGWKRPSISKSYLEATMMDREDEKVWAEQLLKEGWKRPD